MTDESSTPTSGFTVPPPVAPPPPPHRAANIDGLHIAGRSAIAGLGLIIVLALIDMVVSPIALTRTALGPVV